MLGPLKHRARAEAFLASSKDNSSYTLCQIPLGKKVLILISLKNTKYCILLLEIYNEHWYHSKH